MILEAISDGLRRFISERRSNVSLEARIWAELGWLSETTSGINVTPAVAMRVSAVYACVRLLADTIAQLPISIIRDNADGTSEKVNNLPIAKVLREEPNRWQTSFEWRQLMQGHLTLRGNAYSRIIAGSRGAISELIPLNPDRMKVEMRTNGALLYTYVNPQGSIELYDQNEIFHLRGLSSDGIKGLSPLQMARDVFGLALAMERHGASTFKNGARPAIVLRHPGRMTELAMESLRKRWERIHGGVDNAGKTAVLEEGMGVEKLGMTADDAQYIQSREFQLSEIARIFRIPLHLIQDTRPGAVGYSSVEQLSLAFVKFTLGPWLRAWEETVKRDLLVGENLSLKFNLNALLRGDATTRAQFYRTLWEIGVFSPNDVRELEDMDPTDGGDQRFVPLNMVPLSMAEDKAAASMAPSTIPVANPPPSSDAQVRELEKRIEFWHNEAASLSLTRAELELRATYHAQEIGKAIEDRNRIAKDLADIGNKLSISEATITEQKAKLTASEKIIDAQILLEETTKAEILQTTSQLDATRAALRSATDYCLAIMVDCAARMISWEIGAVQRATKKPNFLAAIDEFYADHEQRFTTTMRCPCDLYQSLTGITIPCSEIVSRHLTESKDMLLDVAGRATIETLGDEVLSVIETWPSRASNWTMIGGEYANA